MTQNNDLLSKAMPYPDLDINQWQQFADKKIWEKGIERSFDASGTMDFCEACEYCNAGYSCAIGYPARSEQNKCARAICNYLFDNHKIK